MNATKKIDVVYVLGSGSTWHNNEIRFSLRSLQINLRNFGKIWIIGQKPDFIKGVNHIPFPDELVNNADGNIIRKVLRVCKEDSLTDDFLFINDDHLVIKPISAINIPPYHKGDLTKNGSAYYEVNFWRGRLYRTKNILIKKGFPALHFDCHTPIVINKYRFPEVISLFDYEKHIGYTMKSLYGNVVYGTDAPELSGQKVTIFRPMITSDLNEYIKNRQFVAFNDNGLTKYLKQWLIENFPNQSKYEKTGSEDPFIEVLTWLNSNERDYAKGMKLYDLYGRSKKVKKYLSKKESTARYFKLEHKLKELLNYL